MSRSRHVKTSYSRLSFSRSTCLPACISPLARFEATAVKQCQTCHVCTTSLLCGVPLVASKLKTYCSSHLSIHTLPSSAEPQAGKGQQQDQSLHAFHLRSPWPRNKGKNNPNDFKCLTYKPFWIWLRFTAEGARAIAVRAAPWQSAKRAANPNQLHPTII